DDYEKKFLLDQNKNINLNQPATSKDDFVNKDALHHAILTNEEALISFLKNAKKYFNDNGYTTGNQKMMKFINTSRYENDLTPFHIAVTEDCPWAIPLLVKYGGDINILEENKASPLFYAKIEDKTILMKELLLNGAVLENEDYQNLTSFLMD